MSTVLAAKMTCKGTCDGPCGTVPDRTGRFILGCYACHMWTLCKKCADVYAMNIQIALGTGDTELTFEEACVFFATGDVPKRHRWNPKSPHHPINEKK